MRITQPHAAKTVAMYSAAVWELLRSASAHSPGVPSSNHQNQCLQLQRILGDLPMAPADYLVFPMHGR